MVRCLRCLSWLLGLGHPKNMTTAMVVGGALVWQSGMAVDADGSPNAYSPNGDGLDYLANAGKPGGWFGIAVNQSGVPYIQGPNDPSPGKYISTTSLVDQTKAVNDPHRYVDSEAVNYITMTHALSSYGVRVGDCAAVCYGDTMAGAVVADVGPHLGEGSIALAKTLGINPDPKRGGCDSGVRFAVFPKTRTGWPRADYAQAGLAYLEGWGGQFRLLAALP